MKAHWWIAVSSMAVLLAGCKTADNVNSVPSRHYEADKYECQRGAQLTVGPKPREPVILGSSNALVEHSHYQYVALPEWNREIKNMTDQCMMARGWFTEYRGR
jgi:ABC-type uncharacterized transport system auxiliary subunit